MEVKTNEGVSSEAVISKLTDASLYTVGESFCHTRSLMIEQRLIDQLKQVYLVLADGSVCADAAGGATAGLLYQQQVTINSYFCCLYIF